MLELELELVEPIESCKRVALFSSEEREIEASKVLEGEFDKGSS